MSREKRWQYAVQEQRGASNWVVSVKTVYAPGLSPQNNYCLGSASRGGSVVSGCVVSAMALPGRNALQQREQ